MPDLRAGQIIEYKKAGCATRRLLVGHCNTLTGTCGCCNLDFSDSLTVVGEVELPEGVEGFADGDGDG